MPAEAVVAEFWTRLQICPVVGLETPTAATEPRLRCPGQFHCKSAGCPSWSRLKPTAAAAVLKEDYERD